LGGGKVFLGDVWFDMNEEEWIEQGGGRPGALSAADLAKFENLWDRRTTVLRFLTEPIVVKLDPSHPEYSRARQVVVTGPNDIVRVKVGTVSQGVGGYCRLS